MAQETPPSGLSVSPRNTSTKIETHWIVKETEGIAEPGDWIATNMTPERTLLQDKSGLLNTYGIKPIASLICVRATRAPTRKVRFTVCVRLVK